MKRTHLAAALALATASLAAQAAVPATEAAKLKGELTPLGAERAGNKDGTIPAWTGGYTSQIPGDKPGGRRGDPFKDEKPLFTITAKNVEQYADKLNAGQIALLKKYPEYHIDVYKTHRTALAPQWVYDNTEKNATRAKLVNGVPTGAFGGTPFPIPQSGEEVMWNHHLRWQGSSFKLDAAQYLITSEGKPVLIADGLNYFQYPYYFADSSLEQFEQSGSEYWLYRLLNAAPPIRAGEAVASRFKFDSDKDQAWVYFAGQRRTRKLPNPCCDTPSSPTAGLMSVDEMQVFAGRMSRFDWKIAGKKELYIPYNDNRELQPKSDDVMLSKTGLNPDYVRWELHRVWVVEAALRQGQRHQVSRAMYYCDEDTWRCHLGDRWDAKGQLWKTLWLHNFVAPDFPAVIDGSFGFNDLLSGTAYINGVFNNKSAPITLVPKFQDNTFSPDALAGEGVR
jgi:hypothetical protein